MAEADSIVGIFGAVDRAVQADPAARARVAQLLAQYRNPQVHWYDDFENWLAGETVVDSAAAAEADRPGVFFPGVGDALSDLGNEPAEGRAYARRMFAIKALNRAVPEMRVGQTDLRPLAVDALRPREGTEGLAAEPRETAEALYRLLTGEEEPIHPDTGGGASRWDELVATAAERRLIPDTIGMSPQPCSGRWLTVPGVNGPVAAVRTEVENHDLDFHAATRFVEPVNWKTCRPDFWCHMQPVHGLGLPPGQRRYHEVVSTHCDDQARPGFWAETDLLFNFMWLPDEKNRQAAVANYELAAGRPHDGDRILVDEGTLVVAKMGEGPSPLRVTTTKRVKFSYPFMTEALALVACALGYADQSGALLDCAARHGKDLEAGRAVGTEFPGISASRAVSDKAPGAAAAGGPARGGRQTASGGLVQDAIDIWARSLRDWASVIERGAAGTWPPKPAKSKDRED